ncbi:hypothetical protein BKA70DRAFT_1225441 [Coprinopsis sp. MPI-PUGE-AT-0042]|nr:hypothetical protein BKA70DRAFT_1225441 [Coprinopsis sp. MPI-PUGE-AT-0042]
MGKPERNAKRKKTGGRWDDEKTGKDRNRSDDGDDVRSNNYTFEAVRGRQGWWRVELVAVWGALRDDREDGGANKALFENISRVVSPTRVLFPITLSRADPNWGEVWGWWLAFERQYGVKRHYQCTSDGQMAMILLSEFMGWMYK